MTRLRSSVALGAGACALALVLSTVDVRAALGGWLVAAVLWSGVPIGALGLLMMMKLVPGSWREELVPWTERVLPLLLLAGLAMLPVLVGLSSLYEWARVDPNGVRVVYLSPWLFVLRTVAFYATAMALAFALLARPALATVLSSAGLIVFVLFDTTMAVDWLMSLDTRFHSSGFGLYVLSIQFTVALAVILVLRLSDADPGENTGMLGGLLLTALLLWAYLAFMQYFILWSGNLPQGVKWYQRRGEGAWAVIEYAIAAGQLLPLFLLFFTPVRQGRFWLISLSLLVLLAKGLEVAWLVLPAVNGGNVAVAAAIAATVGLGMLMGAALYWRRDDRLVLS